MLHTAAVVDHVCTCVHHPLGNLRTSTVTLYNKNSIIQQIQVTDHVD